MNVGMNDECIIQKLKKQMGEVGKNCVVKKNDANKFTIRCSPCNEDILAALQTRGLKNKENWQAQPFLRHLKTKRHLKRLAKK